jgi:ABC-type nitrate/sulfonate/bicarbonate transport system substrate-binding protein
MVTLAFMAAGCGDRGPTVERIRLRVGYTSPTDVGDLPSLMALRTLERIGYRTDATFYARPELAVEALARGDAEFGNGGTRAFWAAVAKGADLVMIMEHVENGYAIVSAPGIRQCRELTGRRLALSSPGALPTAIAHAYLRRCPGAAPQVLDMPSSGDRLAAFAAGAVDAAVLQRADVTRLASVAPGRFRVLVRFDEEFPDVRFEGLFVNRTFARRHRAAVVDYLRARLEANRRAIARPAALHEEARNWPAMGALDAAIVDGEVAAPAWAVDGGLHPGSVAVTLELFVRAGSLPPTLEVHRLADPSFLVEALQTMGALPSAADAGGARRP